MATLKYASLAELRRAIRESRAIRFVYKGKSYEADPHFLESAPITHALYLSAWISGGSGGWPPGWRKFRYSEMRAMEILHFKFTPRPRPTLSIDPAQ
jgi:hypothetical protein